MILSRKLLHGCQCHSSETGTRRGKCRTIPLISQKSGRTESSTKGMCLEPVLGMKRSSPQPHPLPTILTINFATGARAPQLDEEAYSDASIVASKHETDKSRMTGLHSELKPLVNVL